MVAPTPILPKLAPQPVKPVPLFFVPVNLNLNLTNGLGSNGRVQLSLIAAQPPSPPPVPPISLLKQSRRRIPILIDQKSIKKNLQLNKQTLQTKLAARPEPTQLIERGILRSEEEKLRRFQHRENIRSHIEKRPTRETLVTQGILLSDACVDPLIRVRGQLLKRNKLVDNLNNKLRKRPGPLELVNRKILQVDAELEQAVHEGRLPFTSTLSSPSSEFGEATEMISTIIPPPLIRHDEQQYSSSSSSNNSGSLSSTLGPKAKVRKKSQQLHRTPYDNTSINSNKTIKLKAIANSKRSTNDSSASSETTSSNLSADFSNSNGISPMETDDIHSDNMQSETNYEINLKQQQLFLQWQEDHFKNPHDTNAITPAMSSTTSNCSTPLQSNDTPSIHSTRSSFSVSSTHSGNHGNTRLSSLYSPSVSPTHGTETTLQTPIIESEKPKSKLADFKVQDLKIECKKRQLPVSGAKSQLLERLKPYEDIILATSTSLNGSTPSVSTTATTTTTSAISTECSEVSSTSSNTCQNSCGHQQQTIYQTQPLLPAQDVITDYLQQCQPQQSQQQQHQKPLVLQLPPNTKAPQLVQVLVDSNGTVVGVAAMPHQTISPTKSTSIPCCCIQCKKQPGSHISTIAETVIPSKSHESKLNEPTFSFSQMGSGGQFTLANSSPIVSECRQMAPNCAGCIAAASQSALKIVSSEIISTNSTRSSVAATPTNSSNTLCTAPPLIRSHTSSAMSSTKKSHSSLQKSESNSSTVEQTVASVAHRRHSIPASVFSHNEELSDKILSPDQSCQIPSPTGQILSTPDDESDDTNLDEIDPNVLMTAKTFSQHEENLRIQQRLIEDLQAELAKSQEQLRREQKLIIAAKRMQLRTDQQTGKQCTQAEILLNNLDIKQINKHHIQHFIQHKSQQQSVQAQSNDYQELLQVEQKLQEELHMEQAVQDIVRLIKQDGRTALLIVQLLRRYQLERNHQLQQANAAAQQQKQSPSAKLSPSTATPATTVASGQNELTPGSNQQQECSGRTSVMSSKSIANESSGSICCQQHSHQPQSVESCCTNRTRLSQQQKSAQIVVIDDSPATSPAPTNNAANAAIVEEALPKQKETSQRSKSQNPRTNKRKNNGSRSIWAKTNLIEKSASFTNTNTNTSGTPSKVVDMEEIFRTVINDTSYSVDTDTSLSTATLDTCQIQQKSQTLNQQIITNMDASSELVPQLNGFHLVANSDDSSNSAIADEQMDHSSSYHQYPQEYIIQQQPMQTEICSTTAIFVQPENISSCHVDCYSKPRNKNSPERVEIIGNGHEYVQASNIQQYEYAKNEDFEDLMDVLRDDQECIDHGPEDENCGRQILGYTSAELATFLAADENIVNNGNIYESFVQTQGQPHYSAPNYHPHCVQQPNNITYENQGNVDYEITGGNLDPHSTLHIEPHQEQAIDDILNNSDMMEPSVEWFDNYFQSPITERQMTACGNRAPNGPNIHRPMDTFV